MSHTLLLTSEGLPPGIEQLLQGALPMKEKIQVGFIPTAGLVSPGASIVNRTKAKMRDNRARVRMQRLGFVLREVGLNGQSRDSLMDGLAPCDVIYVGGEQPFYLLRQIKDSGFDQAIGELLDEDRIYVGSGAGAQVVSPTIEMARWNEPSIDQGGITDLAALNLVPFLVAPHFSPRVKEAVRKGAATVPYQVFTLTGEQGILVRGQRIEYSLGDDREITIYTKNASCDLE